MNARIEWGNAVVAASPPTPLPAKAGQALAERGATA